MPGRNLTLIVLGLLLSAVGPAPAAYGGLIGIPTADTVGERYYSIEWQRDRTHSDDASNTFLFNTQIGLGDRMEAGVDFEIAEDENGESGITPVYNAKYVFRVDKERSYSFAAGLHTMRSDAGSVPYLVASKCLGRVGRLHIGGFRCEDTERWFMGYDTAVGDRWTLMADYTSGDENASSVGANFQMSENYAVVAGAQFPNTGGAATFTVHFVVGGNYRSCSEE